METDINTGIMYKKWPAAGSPKAVFLLVHGLGGFSGRWDPLVAYSFENNISSYALELKGFGETDGLKGHIDSFDIYLRDIASLYKIIKKENNGIKVFLIGESMGGLISFLAAAIMPDFFDGLICVSPAFKNRMKFSFFDELKFYLGAVFYPKKQFKMPFDSVMCTHDPDFQNALNTDNREHRFATPKLLFNMVLAWQRIKSLKDKIRIPVLFLIAGELDLLVDPNESKKIFKTLKVEDKQLIEYPQMYHSLPIELGREKVFEDLLSWVDKRI